MKSCSGWSPSPTTVDSGTSFTQTRSCSQDQKKTYTHKVSSSTVHYRLIDQTITVGQSQSAIGTKNIVVSTSYGSWTGYSNSGSAYSCSAYGAATDTVNSVQSFTQTRSCSQNQVRSRTIYDVWSSGAYTTNRIDYSSRVVGASQSRGNTGTRDYITGTSTLSWSSWSNSGGAYNWSGWSSWCSQYPGQQYISTTRTYSQDQTQYQSHFDNYASGSRVYSHKEYNSRTVTFTYSDPNYKCF